MGSFLSGIAIVFGFAWLGRALLDARTVTWGRLALAAWFGIAIGYLPALLLLVPDFTDVPADVWPRVRLLAIPFQVIATMGAIVVLELLFGSSGSKARTLMGATPAVRRLGPRSLLRALQVSRIVARHGVAPLLGIGRGGTSTRDPVELARRARMAIEEAGGIFPKLGQLLATRPDLLPSAAMQELGRLHAAVAPLPRDEVERQIALQLGRPIAEVFADVDWHPLGSASIAQAHAATTRDGTQVVVKVRRPGLERVVARDLAILGWLARTAARRTRWGATFQVAELAEEFADAMAIELDFRIEAERIDEVAETVSGEPLVRVPKVLHGLTSSGMVVMERIAGASLASGHSLPADRARALADALCHAQLRAMLTGERFHGDPHPGNVLLLSDGTLGLIDMGISSRLDTFEREAVLQMLVALHHQQPGLLVEGLASLGALDPAVHDPDRVERAAARYMASYVGPNLPPARAMTDLLRLVTDLGLHLPRTTTTMFRALATLAGTLEQLSPGYPIVEAFAEVGGETFERRLMPDSALAYVKREWSELAPLLERFPRHVDRLATMLTHGRITTRTRLFADESDRRFLERVTNRGLLAALSIGTGVVGTMLLDVRSDTVFPASGIGVYEVFGWLGLVVAVSLLFRVVLAVLRSDAN